MCSSTLVDEFGFDRIERQDCGQAAHLLYKVITSRHQKGSTILITNVLCAAPHNKLNAERIVMRGLVFGDPADW